MVFNVKKERAEIVNARTINKMRWITGLVVSASVIAITSVVLVLNISDFYQEGGAEAGIGTLKMFTTLANIIAAIAAFMCLPFQINGLRKDKYKLPAWIVTVLYIGAVGTFLTFFIAITLLSITQGFVYVMFSRSNLFMHTINPLFITILFVLIISDFQIRFRVSFLTLIPVTAYSLLYYIMVFAIGAWRDHYETNTFIPWPISLLAVILVAFGVSQLLRILHNLTNKYVTNSIQKYYLQSSDYSFPKIREAVIKLAEVESKYFEDGDDIYIPTDIIALLSQRYGTDAVPIDILYDIYLESYLKFIKGEKQEK